MNLLPVFKKTPIKFGMVSYAKYHTSPVLLVQISRALFIHIGPYTYSSSSRSHLIVGSLQQTQFSSSQFYHGLHLLLFRPIALMSRLTQSIHLCFGLPLFLLPGGTISRVFLPTYRWSRLFTCPNHLSTPVLLSCTSL